MSKVYVILERTFEYNDQTYDETGSSPVKIFTDIEKANKERLKREIQAFKECEELGAYFDPMMGDSGEELNEALKAAGFPGLQWNDYSWEFPEEISDTEIAAMLPALTKAGCGFFTVQEVEMEDG